MDNQTQNIIDTWRAFLVEQKSRTISATAERPKQQPATPARSQPKPKPTPDPAPDPAPKSDPKSDPKPSPKPSQSSTDRSKPATIPGVTDTIIIDATHGIPYGSHKQGKDIYPGIINAVDIAEKISSSGLYQIVSKNTRQRRRYGHPILEKILIDAATEVKNIYPSQIGLPYLGNISLPNGGPLWVDDENPASGTYSTSHQIGLDLDVTFYTKKVLSWTGGAMPAINTKAKFDEFFDVARNVKYLHAMQKTRKITLIVLHRNIVRWINEYLTPSTDPFSLSSPKELEKASLRKMFKDVRISADRKHDDHFHFRISKTGLKTMTLRQFEKKHGTWPGPPPTDFGTKTGGANHEKPDPILVDIVQETPVATNKKPETSGFKAILKACPSIEDIKDKYGKFVGYTFGTIEGERGKILLQHNEDTRYIGASMPKTMAGLAQLVKYKNDPKAKMSDCELIGLLTYWSRSSQRNAYPKKISYRGPCGRYPESNTVLTNISKGDPRGIILDRRGRPLRLARKGDRALRRANGNAWAPRGLRLNFGQLDNTDVKKVSDLFGITNSKFLFWSDKDGSRNRQTPKDTFLFWVGMQKLYNAVNKSKNQSLPSGHPLQPLLDNYRQEVIKVIAAQRLRAYSSLLHASGITEYPGHWGKGGASGGQRNFAFIVPDVNGKTYVLSVFAKTPRRLRGTSMDLLNATLYRLKEEMEKQ